ncbi:MAG: hypothetical protein K0U86_06165 [Planctomycetes bacterium]|nr:hypothetical protein [Planctomycetota bacterium]MCH9724472.1 hypothetical protein [Planctomycetota bacterium]MCH9778214.1 hypothetical protein [Planctomycetota bacterium]MDF1746129.1 hypothetical protein [Gimesia sp.]
MNTKLIILIFLSGSVWNHCILAQEIRIQQPIVQQFSARTTVSVPDRGSAVLGSIHSGATWNRQSGPFRRGSSYGQSFQSSTTSVSAYIHDFEAMDRMLLNSAPASSHYLRRNSQTNLEHWKNNLFSRRRQMSDMKRSSGTHDLPQSSASVPQVNPQAKAERFFQLGQNAEKKHATPNIAILHYRVAEKYGSSKATARLQKLISLKENRE